MEVEKFSWDKCVDAERGELVATVERSRRFESSERVVSVSSWVYLLLTFLFSLQRIKENVIETDSLFPNSTNNRSRFILLTFDCSPSTKCADSLPL